MLKPTLTDIEGVGTQTAATLASHGIKNLETLARVPLEEVTAIPGFGPTRAANIQATAELLLRAWAESKGGKGARATQDAAEEGAMTETKTKPKKKAKKKKKKDDDKKKNDKKGKKGKGKKKK